LEFEAVCPGSWIRSQGDSSISSPRVRARPSDVGWHALSQRLVALQFPLLAGLLVGLPFVHLAVVWSSGVVFWVVDGVVLLLWGALRRPPGRSREWLMAEVVLVLALTLTVSHILSHDGTGEYRQIPASQLH
jgi:hypothetical protein